VEGNISIPGIVLECAFSIEVLISNCYKSYLLQCWGRWSSQAI